MNKIKKTKTIAMHPDDEELLVKVAKADKRSQSGAIAKAVEEYAKKLGVLKG